MVSDEQASAPPMTTPDVAAIADEIERELAEPRPGKNGNYGYGHDPHDASRDRHDREERLRKLLKRAGAALRSSPEAAPAADTASKILDHKWLDPKCIESGCQSLVLTGVYESAVKGRQEFRDALREAKALRAEVRAILASTDAGSLPNDYPTARMATVRMDQLDKARQERAALSKRVEELSEPCRVIATAEFYDPATGLIDLDVFDAVQEVARAALSNSGGRDG